MTEVRPARAEDALPIWTMLEPVIRAGESLALDRDMPREAALAFWCADAHETFVAEQGGAPLGTYFMRRNKSGGGAHAANCGYVTAEAARGKGIARTMLNHSLDHAKKRGYRAMFFNFVIESNQRAVKLWQSCGFEIVGRLPDAFDHPREGLVDALVMHRRL